jgi:hypothetical protein
MCVHACTVALSKLVTRQNIFCSEVVCGVHNMRHARSGPAHRHTSRVGQNRIYTPCMTVYSVISLPKIPYIHRIYMVLANPTYMHTHTSTHAIHTFAHTLTHSLVNTHMITSAQTHTHTHLCTHSNIQMHIYTQLHTHMSSYRLWPFCRTHQNTHTHTNTRTQTHTHTHTLVHTRAQIHTIAHSHVLLQVVALLPHSPEAAANLASMYKVRRLC